MSLSYSDYASNDNITNTTNIKNQKNREKINKLRSSLKRTETLSAIEDESLANFTPIPPPRLSRTPQNKDNKQDKPVTKNTELDVVDQSAQNYYKQYTDMYQSAQLPIQQVPNTNDNNLINKLNYVIHLLEEQQDQKTDTVTEEIILYAFLGVFIIFIIDSFARAGKYVR